MKKLWLVASMVSIVSSAYAAPEVANTGQKGSALVFPRVVVSNTATTYIRLANDGSASIDVHCEYRDSAVPPALHAGFVIQLKARQAFWFDAAVGGTADTKPVPPYPGSTGQGLLACWAVDTGDTTQIRWNHISGTANIVDTVASSAVEYPAWAFAVRAPVIDKSPIGIPGVINLDGIEYDACPRFLHGVDQDNQNNPNTAAPPANSRARVVITPCTFDLRQDFDPFATSLRLRTWTTAGALLGDATTAASYWQDLTDGNAGQPVSFEYRSTTGEGLIGVQYRPQGADASSTELSASGSRAGVILWDADQSAP